MVRIELEKIIEKRNQFERAYPESDDEPEAMAIIFALNWVLGEVPESELDKYLPHGEVR